MTVEDDVLRWDVLGRDEPVEYRVSVLLHRDLVGMAADATAVAAVVEEKDVEAGVVECECAWESVGDGAIGGVKEERGGGGWCGCVSGRGNEPAVELRQAGGIVGELEIGEFEADRCGCSGDGARGVKDELPLALIPEETERTPGAEERDDEHDGECFEDPARIDQLRCGGLWTSCAAGAAGARRSCVCLELA